MSEKNKKRLDKFNKILGILCAVAFIVAACRITHYHISEYVDNSVNDYAVVHVEEQPKNNDIK